MSLATPGCVQELQTASHASLIYPGGVCLFREPDAVTPPVRFDEREQETELGQTGLRRAKRKPSPTATGRLRPLRLFSTLPQIPSGKADECSGDVTTVTPSFSSSKRIWPASPRRWPRPPVCAGLRS